MESATLTEEPGTDSTETMQSPDELAQFLNRRESYGDGTSAVEFKETHISWVALTDRRVYKVKKPVRFPFLDYSTLELRLNACCEELRLGSRLAPGVYLGHLPITRGPLGGLQFSGDGSIVDYCVVMKRLPAQRMLDRLIRGGSAATDDIEQLLNVLVPFYTHAACGSEIERYATAAAIERQARENLATIDSVGKGDRNLLPERPEGCFAQKVPVPVSNSMFQRVRASQLQFLKLSADLFAERIRAGRVCEGHGDLRPEHVCMTSPPVVFDCVEFSLPLRAADVASELAFLAMECDFLGAPELATALIERYKLRSGDAVVNCLVSFYKLYRACIRAKVELLRAAQQTDSAATRCRTRARRYLQLASFYATEFYRPKLFVMVGAAGTGKSTVANALAGAFGLEMLRTDTIRHELAGQREPNAAYRQGIYSESMTFWTYETLFDRAETLLGEAISVVLDGTFRDTRQRDRAVELARRFGAEVHFVYCQCPDEVARGRIAERIGRRESESDARPKLFDLQQQELQATDDWSDRPVVLLDTTQPVCKSVARVIETVRCREGRAIARPQLGHGTRVGTEIAPPIFAEHQAHASEEVQP